MVRSRLIAFILVSLLVPSAVLAAEGDLPESYIGVNRTTVNLNIRSEPMVGENLIGHFNRGDEVLVTRELGDWCEISHDRYHKAYVYCPYLVTEDPATQEGESMNDETESSPADTGEYTAAGEFTTAESLLSSLNNWLLVEGDGKKSINDSYWQAYTKALEWREEAKLAGFNLEYPSQRDQFCDMVFSSAKIRMHLFKAWCLAGDFAEPETVVLKTRAIPEGFDIPSLTFSDFVFGLLDDQAVLEALSANVEDGSPIRARFRLYKDEGGAVIWEAVFTGTASGAEMTVRADANPGPLEEKPSFVFEPGENGSVSV